MVEQSLKKMMPVGSHTMPGRRTDPAAASDAFQRTTLPSSSHNAPLSPLARIPGEAKGARVMLPDGGLRLIRPPATAAELMLEAPGHFLANKRAVGGPPDHGACGGRGPQPRGICIAFPMKRLGSMAVPADVAGEAHARRHASAKVAAIVMAPPEVASILAEEIRREKRDERRCVWV